MSSTDLRGFADPLQPVRRQREWQLDLALARVAALRTHVSQCEARHRAAEQEAQAQALLAGQAWKKRMDPGTRGRMLEFLAQLHERKLAIEKELEQLRAQVTEAQELVMQRQRNVEVLQRHREDALSAYRVEQDRKQAAQADQEWTMRGPLREGAGA